MTSMRSLRVIFLGNKVPGLIPIICSRGRSFMAYEYISPLAAHGIIRLI